MSASKEDINDLQFILDEGIRLRKLFNSSYELFLKDFDNKIESMTALLYPPKDLRDVDYSLQFYISSKARRRFKTIAKRQLKSIERVSLDELIEELNNSFYIHIKNGSSFDNRGCQKLVSRARNRVLKSRSEVTYYIPFNAPGLSSEMEVGIGNIKILDKSDTYEKVKEDSYFGVFVENETNNFNCLLSIPVSKSSPKISKQIALNVADFIYGVVKVFATSYRYEARQLKLLGQPLEKDATHYIANRGDKFWLEGNIKFGEDLKDFWSLFKEDLNTDLGSIIKELVGRALTPTKKELLADRLIDAFVWFGDASIDSNKSAQTIKLVTAMERLFTLSIENNEGITENFCNRVACSIAIYHGEIDKWRSQANKLYNLRSKLVHGSISLYKPNDDLEIISPFIMCYRSILSSCILFSKIDIELTNYDKRLQIAYNGLVDHCKDDKYKVKFE